MSAGTTLENPDRVRNLLAFFLVGSFVGVLPLFIIWGMPATSKDIVTYMVGQLSGMATMALGFFFTNKAGQDALDSKRVENTGKLADAVVAAAAASPATDVAARAADDVAAAAADRADEIGGKI